MTLQVHVEGLAPYEVEDQCMVKAKDTEGLSRSIPVKVDPKEQEKVAIDWETLREEAAENRRQRREALASGGGAGPGGFGRGAAGNPVTPVIDMRNDPELRAKIEKVLGRELTPGSTETIAKNDPQLQMRIMQVMQEHMASKAGTGAGATPKEFEQAKQRVLRGG